ncbi:MAG: four helix bundle protein [Flammeovirgaceae bacterium]|jgi:four helix bundle protein
MNQFKNLKVWQKSVEIAVDTYKATKNFPNEEKFGLTSQINRSAVSIPSNIAEGAGRNTSKDFNQFLGIAQGSAFELYTQLLIANKVDLLENEKFDKLSNDLDEVQKMIFGLKKSLKVK